MRRSECGNAPRACRASSSVSGASTSDPGRAEAPASRRSARSTRCSDLRLGSSGSSFVGERDKQAVASEIVAGAIRGSKYWGYDQLTTLWQGLLPIWELVAKHAAGDILDDWACALDVAAARRDPRRLWWLTEWLAARDLHANTDTKQCVAVLTLTEAVRAS